MVGIASVLVVAAGLYFTNEANRAQQDVNSRQLDVALQGQITERFGKTVEQLGSATLDVRLGSIYALERIMRDSADDQAAVVDILAAYVRTHAPRAGSLKHASSPFRLDS